MVDTMWWENAYRILKKEGYKFHNTIYDNKDKIFNLEYGIDRKTDVEEIVIHVNSEINEIIKRDKIEIVIPIQNKGEIIYQSLRGFFEKDVKMIETYKIDADNISQKNIMLFDDSIKTGNTIKLWLYRILKYKPRKIVVYNLVVRNDSLEKLKSKFKEIKFYARYRTQKEIFTGNN